MGTHPIFESDFDCLTDGNMGDGINSELLDRMCLTNQSGECFHHSRIIQKSSHFVVYRAVISTYFLAWLIAQTSQVDLPLHFIYLTTWGEFLLNIYLLSALILAIYYNSNPDLIHKSSGAQFPGKPIKMFELFVGVLRIWAFDMSLSLSIAYWTLLRTDWDPFSWHCHLINSIAVLIDLIVSDQPIRPIQSFWSLLIALGYTVQTIGVYHYGREKNLEKYKVLYEETLDWGGYPLMSAIVCSSVGLILMPSVHCAQYWIQKIRNRILDRNVSFEKISLHERDAISMIEHI